MNSDLRPGVAWNRQTDVVRAVENKLEYIAIPRRQRFASFELLSPNPTGSFRPALPARCCTKQTHDRRQLRHLVPADTHVQNKRTQPSPDRQINEQLLQSFDPTTQQRRNHAQSPYHKQPDVATNHQALRQDRREKQWCILDDGIDQSWSTYKSEHVRCSPQPFQWDYPRFY